LCFEQLIFYEVQLGAWAIAAQAFTALFQNEKGPLEKKKISQTKRE
jgi:hypothetical protein